MTPPQKTRDSFDALSAHAKTMCAGFADHCGGKVVIDCGRGRYRVVEHG